MTDSELDNLAQRFEELGLIDVTFEQFCALPRYYERLAQFRSIVPDVYACEGCQHYDGALCNGNADDCGRIQW